jgi:hypothetical protein
MIKLRFDSYPVKYSIMSSLPLLLEDEGVIGTDA